MHSSSIHKSWPEGRIKHCREYAVIAMAVMLRYVDLTLKWVNVFLIMFGFAATSMHANYRSAAVLLLVLSYRFIAALNVHTSVKQFVTFKVSSAFLGLKVSGPALRGAMASAAYSRGWLVHTMLLSIKVVCRVGNWRVGPSVCLTV